MKRLVVCCDGTWNRLGRYPTNVVKLAQATKPFASDGISQVVFYQQGLGTNWYDRVPGGAFGWGIDYNIQNAYQFLCFNYDPGDEIYLFGFSRGAYTARSLAGMIYCSGLLARQYIEKVPQAYNLYREPTKDAASKEAKKIRTKNFRFQYGVRYQESDQIPITLLGCWDTVGSLGIPNLLPFLPLTDLINAKYRFHDTELNRMIQNAIHAVAIDERRKVFDVTPMEHSSKNPNQKLQQVWFPGGHGCVGGGTEQHCKLSDAALQWMMDEIARFGLKLEFDVHRIQQSLVCDPLISFDASPGFFGLAGLHDRRIRGGFEALHSSVKIRWRNLPNYRPVNLQPFAEKLNAPW
ncbi:MAG: DUF2235 domain-containing protein [Oscillatoriales cyanobacterium C42_A2020_001]|nr:DUF2235 domain-containing protein [Leptolyngbyaceae cyanobacterium C42_A2020_001]